MKRFIPYFLLLFFSFSYSFSSPDFIRKNKLWSAIIGGGSVSLGIFLFLRLRKPQNPKDHKENNKNEKDEKENNFLKGKVTGSDQNKITGNFIFPFWKKIYEEKKNFFSNCSDELFVALLKKIEEEGAALNLLYNSLSQAVFNKYIKDIGNILVKPSFFPAESLTPFSKDDSKFFSKLQNNLYNKLEEKIIVPFYKFLQNFDEYKSIGDRVWDSIKNFVVEAKGHENCLTEFGEKFFYVKFFIYFIYFAKMCPIFGNVIEQNEKLSSSESSDLFDKESGLLSNYSYQSIAVKLENPCVTTFSADNHGSFFSFPSGKNSFEKLVQGVLKKDGKVNLQESFEIHGGDFTDREQKLFDNLPFAIHSEIGELLLQIGAMLRVYGMHPVYGKSIYIPGNHVENFYDLEDENGLIYKKEEKYFKNNSHDIGECRRPFICLRTKMSNIFPRMVFDTTGTVYAHALPFSGSFQEASQKVSLKIDENFSFITIVDNPFQDIEEILEKKSVAVKTLFLNSIYFTTFLQKKVPKILKKVISTASFPYFIQELDKINSEYCKDTFFAAVKKYFSGNSIVTKYIEEKFNNDSDIAVRKEISKDKKEQIAIICSNGAKKIEKFLSHYYLLSVLFELFSNIELKIQEKNENLQKNNLAMCSSSSSLSRVFLNTLSWSRPSDETCGNLFFTEDGESVLEIQEIEKKITTNIGKLRIFDEIFILLSSFIFYHNFGIKNGDKILSVGGHNQENYFAEHFFQNVLGHICSFGRWSNYKESCYNGKSIKEFPSIFHYVVPSPPCNGSWCGKDFVSMELRLSDKKFDNCCKHQLYFPIFFCKINKFPKIIMVKPFDDGDDEFFVKEIF